MTRGRKSVTRPASRNLSTNRYAKRDRSKRKVINDPFRQELESERGSGECKKNKEESTKVQPLGDEKSPRSFDGSTELLHARARILKLFGRADRLHSQIDDAYGGQAFLPDLPPDCPANRRRFEGFLKKHKEATKLMLCAIESWMNCCGVLSRDDLFRVIADLSKRRQRVDPRRT